VAVAAELAGANSRRSQAPCWRRAAIIELPYCSTVCRDPRGRSFRLARLTPSMLDHCPTGQSPPNRHRALAARARPDTMRDFDLRLAKASRAGVRLLSLRAGWTVTPEMPHLPSRGFRLRQLWNLVTRTPLLTRHVSCWGSRRMRIAVRNESHLARHNAGRSSLGRRRGFRITRSRADRFGRSRCFEHVRASGEAS